VAVTGAAGVARAHDPLRADELARWMDELVPEIRATLPATVDRPSDVWLQRELRFGRSRRALPLEVKGLTLKDSRILLVESDEDLRETLCHELVHHLLDESWEPLPAVIEEGLCERVSEELAAGDPIDFRARRLAIAALYLGAIEGDVVVRGSSRLPGSRVAFPVEFSVPHSGIPPADVLAVRESFRKIRRGRINGFHYAFGYWVVDRILLGGGYARLHALARRAGDAGEDLVPPAWLLREAALPPEPSRWRERVLESLDRRAIAELIHLIGGPLARAIAERLDHGLDPGPIGASDLGAISFSLRGVDARADLQDLPAFRAGVLDELERLGRVER